MIDPNMALERPNVGNWEHPPGIGTHLAGQVRDALWRTPNRVWAWRLVPLAGGRTRLINRLRTLYEWRRPLVLLTVMLMECADYRMMRRMLRGIRDRAEAEQS